MPRREMGAPFVRRKWRKYLERIRFLGPSAAKCIKRQGYLLRAGCRRSAPSISVRRSCSCSRNQSSSAQQQENEHRFVRRERRKYLERIGFLESSVEKCIRRQGYLLRGMTWFSPNAVSKSCGGSGSLRA